jgi:hypothetical protein
MAVRDAAWPKHGFHRTAAHAEARLLISLERWSRKAVPLCASRTLKVKGRTTTTLRYEGAVERAAAMLAENED